MQKRPPKSLKNEMLIFGLHSTSDDLHSTSDDWLSNLSDKIQSKCEKKKKLDLKTILHLVLGNITPCRSLSTMITQKLIYTCRWLGFHMDVNGFNSEGVLPH